MIVCCRESLSQRDNITAVFEVMFGVSQAAAPTHTMR